MLLLKRILSWFIDPIASYLRRPEWLTQSLLDPWLPPAFPEGSAPFERPVATTSRTLSYQLLSDELEVELRAKERTHLSSELLELWDVMTSDEVLEVWRFERWRVNHNQSLSEEVDTRELSSGPSSDDDDFYTRETLPPPSPAGTVV